MLSVFITFHGDSRSGESNSVEIKKKTLWWAAGTCSGVPELGAGQNI